MHHRCATATYLCTWGNTIELRIVLVIASSNTSHMSTMGTCINKMKLINNKTIFKKQNKTQLSPATFDQEQPERNALTADMQSETNT